MEILKIENLSFQYPKTESKAIDNINMSVKDGEFVLLCGKSGCGKTTLLRLLKKEIAPYGKKRGNIFYGGVNQNDLSKSKSAGSIGYVLQNPEQQIVTDKVWHELAFGLENLGVNQCEIRRRTAETAAYFGIEKLFHRDTSELSGGEKQILNLASVVVTNPKILILDEPTSQLDPIAAREFISTVERLNKEFGVTVILSEHRMEEVFPLADKVIVLEKGKIIADGPPRSVAVTLKENDISCGFPTPVRIYQGLEKDSKKKCPLTVREGREYISCLNVKNIPKINIEYKHTQECAFSLKDVSFRYLSNGNDILKTASLEVYKGEIYTLLGGNGAGKSTLIKIISGIEKPYSGKVNILGKNVKKYKNNTLYKNTLAVLPQDPQEVFIKNTVLDDFKEIQRITNMSNDLFVKSMEFFVKEFGINHLLDCHPYDLSGGERQKAALVKVLLLNPKILLLDEPTKGMDAFYKEHFAKIICDLKRQGITVFIVSHDIEFAAKCSDRCGLFFDGQVISEDTPEKFFTGNTFYTTAACKIAKGYLTNAVTCEQVIDLCLKSEVT